jgi:transcriptional regulator with XRE-family HTH domain
VKRFGKVEAIMQGQVIQSAREAKGWTREELAVKVGVAGSTVWKWETGKAQPHKVFLKEVCRVLGLDCKTARAA